MFFLLFLFLSVLSVSDASGRFFFLFSFLRSFDEGSHRCELVSIPHCLQRSLPLPFLSSPLISILPELTRALLSCASTSRRRCRDPCPRFCARLSLHQGYFCVNRSFLAGHFSLRLLKYEKPCATLPNRQKSTRLPGTFLWARKCSASLGSGQSGIKRIFYRPQTIKNAW